MAGKKENYFEREMRENGSRFLDSKTAEQLQQDSAYIFKQLAGGFIDLNKYREQLLHPQLLESCIEASRIKYLWYSVEVSALNMYIYQLQNPSMQLPCDNMSFLNTMLDTASKRMYSYQTIYEAFHMVKTTCDVNALIVIPSRLRSYRNYL